MFGVCFKTLWKKAESVWYCDNNKRYTFDPCPTFLAQMLQKPLEHMSDRG